VLNATGRIVRENEPVEAEASPGPRFYIGGYESGNIALVRHDVSPNTAAALLARAETERPLMSADDVPQHLAAYIALLARDVPVQRHSTGIEYLLPHGTPFEVSTRILSSGTPDADALAVALAARGLPQPQVAAGFRTVEDFWPPWCIAFEGDDIASVAFAARLGPAGAELGLYTFPPYRGRGLGAAVSAAWSAHPTLRDRVLFYGTSPDNISSRRVIDRLGLQFLGANLRIY
jgi:hypothetical protein